MKLDPQLRTLRAIKPHKYGTRHLTAGEEYEAPSRHAVALVAARKAEFSEKHVPAQARKPQSATAAKPAPIEAPPSIDDLRQQATDLGIDVDGRWGAGRLQYEIDKAKHG